LEGCEKILNDEFASYSEQSLYMIGSIEEAKMIDLKILLPEKPFKRKSKITAEAENGWFCLLPKHVDFTTSLTPGILIITTVEGKDVFWRLMKASW